MARATNILARLILPASVALVAGGGVTFAQQAPRQAGGTELTVPGDGQVQGREGIPDRMEPMPEEMRDVRVDEHFGAKLPSDATFKGEDGKPVQLGELFKSGKPVILQMGYMSCPKLCDQISQNTVDSLSALPMQMGRDYTVVFISIDPNEKHDLAAEKKLNYVRRYVDGDKHDAVPAQDGWHLLTGGKGDIDRVADAVGFHYKFIESTQQYSHPSAIAVVTPDGKVASYLYGVAFDPQLLKVALVKAADNRTGSLMDRIIMTCVHVDPNTGKYSVAAMRIMRVGGALSVLGVLGMMGLMSLAGRKARGIGSDKPKRGLAAVVSPGVPDSSAVSPAVVSSSQPNTKS